MSIHPPVCHDHTGRGPATLDRLASAFCANCAAEHTHTIGSAITHLHAAAADLRDRSAMLSARTSILCEQSAMLRAQSSALRATNAAYAQTLRQAIPRIRSDR
jgi:ABC-type transporter Mla subunit MlaD